MTGPSRDVAIIGMACLFPKAPGLRDFWENILSRVDAIGDPPEGWAPDPVDAPDPREGREPLAAKGGFLGDLARFDPLEFGVMPRAVDGAEPEHFVALRLASEALADAGYLDRPFDRQKAGVILGRGTYVNRGYISVLQHAIVVDQTIRLLAQLHPDYPPEVLREIRRELKAGLPPFNAETAPGLAHSVMCGRIANRLDLMGPAFTLDAACASSLVAVEQGMRHLLDGTCDLVLAGGIQVSTSFPIALVFERLGALSRSGRLRPFHPEADGTLLGEGAGVLVLKRRADAERDGDRIYAVIKAVGLASDGKAVGVLTPRVEGEELAMRRAYERSGVDPRTVGLVEAHGTGTPVGDAAELEALGRVFGDRDPDAPPRPIGSVKSMIGHCIPAAGAAGLIKAALALYHKIFPPTLHDGPPHPALAAAGFAPNPEARPWIHGRPEPRRAAVSAFGFGGIDSHAILEEHGGAGPSACVHARRDSELFLVYAGSRRDLLARCEALAAFLGQNPDVPPADLAYTLNCPGPPDGDERLAIVARSADELRRKLGHAAEKLGDPSRARIKDRSGIFFVEGRAGGPGGVAFLFPGEGAQYAGMMAELCLHFPEARAWFDLMDRAFRGQQWGDLPSQVVFPAPGTPAPRIWEMDRAIAAVFAADQAMHAVLTGLGLRPCAVAGHSSGEYSALMAAGAIVADSEAEVIAHVLDGNRVTERALRDGLVPEGTLLAVGPAASEAVRSTLARFNGAVHVAMDNCPGQLVLCGSEPVVDRLQAELRSRSVLCRRLPFRRAYHTPLFAPVCEQLRGFYERLRFASPKVPVYSCATATPLPGDPEGARREAREQWMRPVRFRETIETMYASGLRTFVEVGPRGNLTAFVESILGRRPHVAVAPDLPSRSGVTQLHLALGLLAAHGVPLALGPLYERRGCRKFAADAIRVGARLPSDSGRPPRLSLDLPALRLEGGPRLVPPASPSPSVMPAVPEGPGPVAGPPGFLGEYLDTMERFLETQELALRALLPAQGQDAPRGGDRDAPRGARPSPGPPSPPGPVAGEAGPGPSPRDAEPAGRESVRRRLLDSVAERTGYPAEILDLDADLEADLGIDSIKRVEILGTLARETGLLPGDRLEAALRLRTLGQIVAFVADGAPGPAPGRSPIGGFLVGEVEREDPGRVIVATRTFDLERDPYLRDHVLGPVVSESDPGLTALPVVPFALSVELMAEVASLVRPGEMVVGLRDVRCARWIALGSGRCTLRATALGRDDEPSEVTVEVREVGGVTGPGGEGPLVIRGVVLFGDRPAVSEAGAAPLRGARAGAWGPERLYAEGERHGMFHGPAFQGVASIDRVCEDGADATVRDRPDLLPPAGEAGLITRPLLLDAAGQAVGFWAAEQLERAFVVFPVAFRDLRLGRSGGSPPAATCRVRVTGLDEARVRSDLEVVDDAGEVALRVLGWEDKRYDLPGRFFEFRLDPSGRSASEPWEAPLAGCPGADRFRCCRLEWPDSFLDQDAGIWQEGLAHLALSRAERERWRAGGGPPGRRREWLLGRVAAKDAVRLLLRGRDGPRLYPADVEVVPDATGRPGVSAPWLSRFGRAPLVSIAHSEGLAVAVAGRGEGLLGVGIDVERLRPLAAGFVEAAFRPDERDLLATAGAGRDDEWALRLWCAKEAAAKALGRTTGSIAARRLHLGPGTVELSAPGAPADRRDGAEVVLVSFTAREGDLITAFAACEEQP
jgi:acyl transferase domain-containing protein/4'-phosphopantetheinyl transferase EntD/acyl carrier protein